MSASAAVRTISNGNRRQRSCVQFNLVASPLFKGYVMLCRAADKPAGVTVNPHSVTGKKSYPPENFLINSADFS